MSYIGQAPEGSIIINNKDITATEGQTIFPVVYDDYVEVYLNGSRLIDGDDFIKSGGTQVTLMVGATAGDAVSVSGYESIKNVSGDSIVYTDTATSNQYTIKIINGVVTPTLV